MTKWSEREADNLLSYEGLKGSYPTHLHLERPSRAKNAIAFLPALRPPTSPLLHTQISIYPFCLLHLISFTHYFSLPFKLFLIFFAVIFFLSFLFSLSAILVCCLLSNLQIAQSVSD
jgi:hypothetical protein